MPNLLEQFWPNTNLTVRRLEQFERLLNIMGELRNKCPGDKKQTLDSLRYLTIEETYALADAILDNDLKEIKKELGDILLHIVFYAKLNLRKRHLILPMWPKVSSKGTLTE